MQERRHEVRGHAPGAQVHAAVPARLRLLPEVHQPPAHLLLQRRQGRLGAQEVRPGLQPRHGQLQVRNWVEVTHCFVEGCENPT